MKSLPLPLFLAVAWLLSVQAHACSMFTLVRDGVVLMGNNEDFVEPGYVWFVPPVEGRLGRVNFGFKGDRFAQGSMNEMVTLDLAGELAKGEHRVALKELFQHSPKLKSITSAEPRVYDTRIDLPKDILAKYLGRYSVLDGKTLITIERGEKDLLLNPGNGKSAHLFPENETTFRIVEGGQIAFKSSETGAVNGFVMYRNGDHKGTRLAN